MEDGRVPDAAGSRRSVYDTWGGGLVALVGAYVAYTSLGFGLGEIRRMGPGMFPLVGGLLLMGLGIAVALFVRDADPGETRLNWRAPIALFASLLVWGLLVERAGFVPATVALVLVAAFAHPRPNALKVAITAVLLPLIGWGLFIVGLGIPVQAFGGR